MLRGIFTSFHGIPHSDRSFFSINVHKEKVAIAREVANPKWTPASLADKILAQHRSNRVQS